MSPTLCEIVALGPISRALTVSSEHSLTLQPARKPFCVLKTLFLQEEDGYVVYNNYMSSSYEVGIGPKGSITRDSHFE